MITDSRFFRPLLLCGIAAMSLSIGACETREVMPAASDPILRVCTDEDWIAFPSTAAQDLGLKSAWGQARSIEVALVERSLGIQILLREGQATTSTGSFWKSEVVCVRGSQALQSSIGSLKLSLPYRVGERGVRHRVLKIDFAQEQLHFRFDEGRGSSSSVSWAALRSDVGIQVFSQQELKGWEVVSRSTLSSKESGDGSG